MLFQVIDFKVICLQGLLGGIDIGYLNVLLDYKIIFSKALLNFNCQLDTAWSHLRRESQLRNYLDQTSHWARLDFQLV